jgi:hypothetical protein
MESEFYAIGLSAPTTRYLFVVDRITRHISPDCAVVYNFNGIKWENDLIPPQVGPDGDCYFYDGADALRQEKINPIRFMNEGFADEGLPYRMLHASIRARRMTEQDEIKMREAASV